MMKLCTYVFQFKNLPTLSLKPKKKKNEIFKFKFKFSSKNNKKMIIQFKFNNMRYFKYFVIKYMF